MTAARKPSTKTALQQPWWKGNPAAAAGGPAPAGRRKAMPKKKGK